MAYQAAGGRCNFGTKVRPHGRGPITRRSFPREAFPRYDTQGVRFRARIAAPANVPFVYNRAETLRAEKIGALSDPKRLRNVRIVPTPLVRRVASSLVASGVVYRVP